MPGYRSSSSRSAAHFASPTVSPVASTVSRSEDIYLRAFFFRRTGCGCGGCLAFAAGAGFGGSGLRLAPLPPPPPSSGFGGVRDDLWNSDGAGVFGSSRLVIRPWPTVQRFVVTQ